MKFKLLRVSTVYMSSSILLKGQLNFLNEYFDLTVIFGGSIKEHEKLRQQEGVKSYNVKFVRNISIFRDLRSLIQMYLYLKENKPFIIHSITPKAGLVSMIAARLAGVPIRVHTFTGLIFPYRSGLLKMILIFMDKLICACATHVYPEGNGVKEDLIRYNITKRPLKVIGNGNINGVDLEVFNPELFNPEALMMARNDLGISQSDFVFVFVGRVVKDKGIEELVTSFSKNQVENKRGRGLKLLIIGSFEDDGSSLKREVLKEMNTNPNILVLGFKEDVRLYLAISDCLVLPSYREGFPNSVIQGGAMGLPSIVTDVSGSNEIIHDGLNGLIVPPKDSQALSESMMRVVSDEFILNSLKKNARQFIVDRYDHNLVWSLVLREYKLLIDNLKLNSYK